MISDFSPSNPKVYKYPENDFSFVYTALQYLMMKRFFVLFEKHIFYDYFISLIKYLIDKSNAISKIQTTKINSFISF